MTPQRRVPVRTALPDPCVQHLDCRWRGECLAVAAVHNWRGITCVGCEDYEALSALEHRADMEGMADLLAAVADGPTKRRAPLRRPRGDAGKLLLVHRVGDGGQAGRAAQDLAYPGAHVEACPVGGVLEGAPLVRP